MSMEPGRLEGVMDVLHSSFLKSVSGMLLFVILALVVVLTATADIDSGLSWLSERSQVDGSIATESGIATPSQATAEALSAFSIAM